MLMIVWNPNGFHVISVFSKGIKFKADHYITDIFNPFAEWRKTQVGRIARKLIVHADIARRHSTEMCLDFLEQNRLNKELHPSYSSDLAPSDFCLFGHLSQLLT
jgi:hypothetical protein